MIDRIGDNLHLPNELRSFVNGRIVGFFIPYATIPESALRTRAATFPLKNSKRAPGFPVQDTHTVSDSCEFEILYYHSHAVLRIV